MSKRAKPSERTAARLGAVQALYQMDLAETDVGETLSQFSTRVVGENFEDGQCGEADYKFLKEVVDGAVREQTFAALNIPAHIRASQLRTNLVRLRSMSGNLGSRYVLCNIPATQIEAVENGLVWAYFAAVVGKHDRPWPERPCGKQSGRLWLGQAIRR